MPKIATEKVTITVPMMIYPITCNNSECGMTFFYGALYVNEEDSSVDYMWQVRATFCPYCGEKQ